MTTEQDVMAEAQGMLDGLDPQAVIQSLTGQVASNAAAAAQRIATLEAILGGQVRLIAELRQAVADRETTIEKLRAEVGGAEGLDATP